MRVRGEVRAVLTELHGHIENSQMISPLRLMDPFALEGGRHQPVPFLLIEDPRLFDQSRKQIWQLDRPVWKHGQSTRNQRSILDGSGADEPLIIYTGEIGLEARDMLPQFCIFDSQDHPERLAYIYWNSLKDLTISKLIRVSSHAFYLRRYAQRIANLWEKNTHAGLPYMPKQRCHSMADRTKPSSISTPTWRACQ